MARLKVQDLTRPPVRCEGCNAMADQSWGKRRYCSYACASNTNHRKRYHAVPLEVRRQGWTPKPETIVPCESCSAPVVRRGNEVRRFCPTCRRGKGHRARAQRYGVPFESVNRTAVFERDGWVCQLCHRPIDKGLSWPHVESVSLDHIVPLSRGGAHVDANVQTTHLGCNIGKGAKV